MAMVFGIHPEEKDEIKLPFEFPVDKEDHKMDNISISPTDTSTLEVKKIKNSIIEILNKKRFSKKDKELIKNLIGNLP